MATEKKDSVFLEKINRVIPFLNGIEPETLEEVDYGLPRPAKSKLYGPNVSIVKKNRYLVLLYIGKQIQLFRADGEENKGYFTPRKILRIAKYEGFKPYKIEFERTHAIEQYMKFVPDLVNWACRLGDKRHSNLFALTDEGEQYCKEIIDDLYRAALPEKSLKENEKALNLSEVRSSFDETQKELYHSYGLNWLAKDYFEYHKSGSNDLDNWRKGFPFELPSIRSKQELRRERLIGDIKARLENEKKILIIGQSGSSKSTILMELMCDYFDAGYEIFYNTSSLSEVKNTDGLVNFIESRLKMNEKILIAVDDAHNDRTRSIFFVVDKLSNSDLTKHLRFIITAREPEFTWLLNELDKVQEELRKSIKKLTGDEEKFIYRLPYFTKREIRDFIKLYLENIDNGEADEKSQEVFDSTRGDPIMIKFNVLGQGLEQDVAEMYYRYLKPQQEMKTMLICSLLDVSNIAVTDRMLKQCGVQESAYHLNGSILNRNAEGLWKTKHPRWDQALFSFLYGKNTRMTLSNSRKQDLKDSLVAICEMREETVAYSAITALYDMVRQNFVPIELFETVFKESILHKPMFLSKEKISSIFVLISEAYYVLKEYQNALDSSNEAVKWNLRNAMAHNKKGVALTYLERNDEAVKCFDKALDMDPGLASVWMHKGNALDFSGHHKEALACYDKSLEIDPHYLSLLASINRGGCFYNMGRYKEAIMCLDKVLNIINSEKMPKLLELLELNEREGLLYQILSYESHTYGLKGMCLSKLGKHEEALRCFDKGLEIDPNNTNTWYQRGSALFELGKYEEAINAYQELLNICPSGWLDVWLRKGALHALLDNNKEAVECYDRVLKIDSNLAEVWFFKCQALIKLGRSDAQYCLDKAKKLGFNVSSLKKN